MAWNPDIILRIEGTDPASLEAIFSPKNRDRFVRPDDNHSEAPASQRTTPSCDESAASTASPAPSGYPCLQLTFSSPPKNIKKGFVFGSDPKVCDIIVGRKADGISGQHFAISFNRNFCLVLKDVSGRGTAVSYNGQGGSQRRKLFTWLLLPGWEIKVHLRGEVKYVFRLVQPDRSECDTAYTRLVKAYLKDGDPESFSEPVSPQGEPVYVRQEFLGAGRFGTVYKATNASTGCCVALKVFKPGTKFDNEVKTMRLLSHENIVRYVGHIEGSEPALAMEYLQLGSLDRHRLNDEEKRILFVQMLQAIQHLHRAGITHRDIKPTNILIQARGESFRAKLSDFGFAKSSDALQSICGSDLFIAPEIWEATLSGCYTKYTNAVDIWSLGVVMLDVFHGLPKCRKKGAAKKGLSNKGAWGLSWCEQVAKDAMNLSMENKDDRYFLLLAKMLVIKDTGRLKACQCLDFCCNSTVQTRPATSSPEMEEVISPTITRTNTSSFRDIRRKNIYADSPSDISILAREICMELARNDPDFANQSWSEVLELKRRGLLPTPRATSRVNTGGSSEVNAMDCRLLDKLESGRVNQIWDDLPAVEQPGEPLRSVTLDDILDRFNSSNGGNTSKWKRSMDDAQNPEFSGRDGRSRREFSSPANTSVFVVNTNLRGKSYNEIEDPVAKAISGLLDELQPELGPSNVANGKSHIQEICKQVRRLDISQLQINRQRGRIDVIALSSGNKTISFTLEGSRGESAAELLLQKMQDQSRAIYKGEIRKQRRPYNYDYNAADEVPAQPKKRFKPSFSQSELLSCRIKDRIVHYRLSDEKICFEELALAAPRSRAWINGKIGKFHDSDKEQCVYGTLVDFSAALPIIKELGLVLAVRKATGFSETPKMQEYRGKKYFPATIGGNEKAILYFCPEDQRVNASRLLEAGGKRRALKDEVLKQCGIRDVLQVRGHPKLQGCYITYADGRKLCRFLGLEVPDAIRGHDGEKEFLKEVNTGADNPCSVHTTFRAESVEGQIETSPPSAEPNTPERALQKKEEGFWGSQVHSHPGEPGPNEGTETTDNPSENDDHMASRVTYMDSSRSCLVAVKPQYGPASVGHPLSGLNMASFEGYYSSFDATSAVPDV
ncbi:hypothetical protein VTO42DRAFT_5183 [Malbranchea cinnamomea]